MRKFFSKTIKYMPFNTLRIFLYRRVLGYKIGEGTIIERKTYLHCSEVDIGKNVHIGPSNIFSIEKLKVGDNTKIISNNKFTGKGAFSIGHNSRIINNHMFDLWNNIYIGNETWIAGEGSQVWTHGSMKKEKKSNNKILNVHIGNGVYMGSSSLIAPGVHISDDTLIGLGSVLTKSVLAKNVLIMGNPAAIVKHDINWRERW